MEFEEDKRLPKDNRNIKSELVKKHFAQTAKQMILEAGLDTVSVRNVAKEAGYAYATIYNHFANLEELLWYTRNIMMNDIADYIAIHNQAEIDDREKICDLFQSYARYFIQNPAAYQFLYFHKMKKSDKKVMMLSETDEFKNQFEKTFEFLATQQGKASEDIMQSVRIILFTIHGLLTLYLSGNEEMSVAELEEEINNTIRRLL